MIDEILGAQTAKDIFFSSMLASLMTEKQAADFVQFMEKRSEGGLMEGIGNVLGGIGGAAAKVLRDVPSALLWTGALGAGSGVLGATAYDVVKERLTQDEPEEKMNEKIESIFRRKKREQEDAQWMDRVRAMRDELKRGYKRMTAKEYKSKYRALLKELGEREVA